MKSMYQRKRGLLRVAAIVQVLIMAGAGCKSSTPKPSEGTGINDVSVSQALVGLDGSRTVTVANTVVNGYAALATDATAGATSIEVTDLDDFTVGTSTRPALATGDLVLIIQMAGATIDPNDTADYGTVTNLNSAGRYEFVGVTGVDAGTDTISLGCGLKHSYTVAGKTQVVRVPQYTNLTIDNGASITADAWDGTVGGVVAVHAMNTITVTGNIDVRGKGFRGGRTHNSAGTMDDMVLFRTNVATEAAMKGEGIAGDPNDASFTNKYGRGAPANAGGGGNWHNAGGGGGANAGALADWTGEGVMSNSVTGGTLAWALDPNGPADSTGGGRGGYTWSLNNADPTAVGPNNAAWGGNNRRQHGGMGGHPLTSSTGGTDPRLFLGGGGGAGDGNNGVAGAGGPGGGLVILIAGTVTGAGTINADGAKGVDATATGNSDAAGGGGGGGSIVVHAGVLSGIGVSAKGGLGGSQIFGGTPGNETEGPGGGGGGGFIALSGGTLTLANAADGALGGTTNSAAVTEFPSNGATAGHAGVANASAALLMYCTDHEAPDAIIISKPNNPSNLVNPTFIFGATEANNGVDAGDNSAAFECRLDDAATFSSCPPTYIVPDLAEGWHTMRVRVKDLSGNPDGGFSDEEIYTWRVDLIAPVPTIVSGPGGSASGGTSNSTTADFTVDSTEMGDAGTDTEIITFECRLDSNDPNGFEACDPNQPSATTFTLGNLSEGSHTLDVRARDNAGNVTAEADIDHWTWTVHALDAGDDSGEDDDAGDAGPVDASVIDALVFADAADTDAEIDSAGVVVLDASSDRSRDSYVAADRPRDTAVRDTWVSLGDAAGDAGEGGVVVLDAASDVTDASRADVTSSTDAGKLDAARPQDTAVAPSPDAYVAPADAAVKPSGNQDASTAPSGIKLMGGGFCSMNPAGSTPGLATLFLVAVFGLMIVRRRRR